MKVYFIQCGEKGPVKVGKAKDVEIRRAELQTGNPAALIIRVVLVADSEMNASYLEREFHRLFKKYHIRGEWFKPNILKQLRGMSMDESGDRMMMGMMNPLGF